MVKNDKVIAICTPLEWTKKPFEKEKIYSVKFLQDAYKKLFLKAEKKNLKFVQTNFEWYDKKTDRFEKCIDGQRVILKLSAS